MGERDPGYTRTIHTANRETSARDEPLYESSLQMGGRDFGANACVSNATCAAILRHMPAPCTGTE